MKLSSNLRAFAGTLTIMLATAASAGDANTASADIAVKFGQQQLNSPEEAQALYGKLKHAAKSVCGLDSGGHVTMEMRNRNKKCYDAVLADAVAKINQPLLTSVHEARGKSSKVG